MNALKGFFTSSAVEALGWTLLHSLWQGLVCACIVIFLLRCIPSTLSRLRYNITTLGLLALVILSVITFLNIDRAADSESTLFPGAGSPLVAYTLPVALADQPYYELIRDIRTFLGSNLTFIVMAWSIGAFIFSLRILSGYWFIAKIKGNALPAEKIWQERVRQLSTALGISRIVSIAESQLIHAPIVIGYFKPIILIPVGLISGLSTEQIESIFIHELIHVRRGDYLVNAIQSFVEALYFFNPFVWIISSCIRREREHCCDDTVIRINGNPLAYVHALATLEEARLSRTGFAVSLAENKNQLLNRIKRIMEKSVQRYSGRERIVPVILLVVGLMCASWLTIQSGKNETFNGDESNVFAAANMTSDTSKKEKSRAYHRKKVTIIEEDGKPTETIYEISEGDDDFGDFMDIMEEVEPVEPLANFDFDFTIPEIPPMPLMDLDLEIPPMPDVPSMDFDFPLHISLDTIHPDHGKVEEWKAFSREFEASFRKRFHCGPDYFEKHKEELKETMEQAKEKFRHGNEEAMELEKGAMDQRLQELAHQQAALERYQSEVVNRERMAQDLEQLTAKISASRLDRETLAAKMASEEQHWSGYAEGLNELEKKIRHLGGDMEKWEKQWKGFVDSELKNELVKDGYVGADEKIRSVDVSNDVIEINGKQIKTADEKKYRAMFRKFEHPSPGRRE